MVWRLHNLVNAFHTTELVTWTWFISSNVPLASVLAQEKSLSPTRSPTREEQEDGPGSSWGAWAAALSAWDCALGRKQLKSRTERQSL